MRLQLTALPLSHGPNYSLFGHPQCRRKISASLSALFEDVNLPFLMYSINHFLKVSSCTLVHEYLRYHLSFKVSSGEYFAPTASNILVNTSFKLSSVKFLISIFMEPAEGFEPPLHSLRKNCLASQPYRHLFLVPCAPNSLSFNPLYTESRFPAGVVTGHYWLSTKFLMVARTGYAPVSLAYKARALLLC